MATRRNVPSKITVRAIKTTLATRVLHRHAYIGDAGVLTRLRYHSTSTYTIRRPQACRAFLLSAIPEETALQALRRSNICHRASYTSVSSSKAFSNFNQASGAAVVELSNEIHSSEELDDALHTSQRRPFRLLRFTNPVKVVKQKSNIVKEKSRPSGTRIVRERTQRTTPVAVLKSERKVDDLSTSVPPYIAPHELIPVYTPHRAAFYRERSSRDLDPRYGYLHSRILRVRDLHGESIALQLAASVLDSYVNTKLDEDWKLVKELYMALCYRFVASDLRTIRNSFIGKMLQESPPRLEAVSLLLEPTEPGSETSARYIKSYLADFCLKVSDPDLQLAEAEKILQGMPESASALKGAVLLPLVRNALTTKSPDRGRDIIARLSETHGLQADFRALSDLVKAYAREGDWSATDALLEDLHHHGYSRSKPYRFAALVRTIYHRFATVRNPSRMFDFLTYSMRNQGLIPTTMLSVSVVKDFVASKRYDLVQRFVHARRLWFPNLLNSMDTPLAAYEIGEAWTHSAASPDDVLSTCRALAYSTVQSPFSEEFRHMTNTYLLRSLYKSWRMLSKQMTIGKQTLLDEPTSLRDMFESTDKLGDLTTNKVLDTRTSLLLDAFYKQVEAARDAELLVNRFSDYIQQRGMVPKFEADEYQQKRLKKKVASTLDLSQDFLALPGHILAREVINLHQEASQSEDRDKRDLVISVVRYLQHDQRHYDCAIFLRQIWKSGSLDSPFAIHEVIKSWVRMAFELRDAKTLHEALWAVVDADPAHTTGYKLLMLIRAAVAVVMEQVHVGKLKQYPNQLEELKYLISRCYRRRWQQDGCPKTEDITDPYLKKWKVEQDSTENAPVRIRSAYIF